MKLYQEICHSVPTDDNELEWILVKEAAIMKDLLNKHQFWACLAMLSMFMAIVTGHQLVSGGHKKEEKSDED